MAYGLTPGSNPVAHGLHGMIKIMHHRKVLAGIHAELGIAVYIQHGDIEVRDQEVNFEVPGTGESSVGDHEFVPEPLVGFKIYVFKKTPGELFDKLEKPHYYRVNPLISQDGSNILYEIRKLEQLLFFGYFLIHDLIE
jgi:hypothetical protein